MCQSILKSYLDCVKKNEIGCEGQKGVRVNALNSLYIWTKKEWTMGIPEKERSSGFLF
jgi:hypothetical protein